MHPALSVILFTTISGAGYGLVICVALGHAAGLVPADNGFAVTSLSVSAVLTSAGLIASLFHLGRPERAWRAFSQWRSSWLSREGVAALAVYPALIAFAWAWLAGRESLALPGGALAAALAVAAIWCTAMIYRTLKPVHQWCNRWVVPNYFALALMSGALWTNLFVCAWQGWRGAGIFAAVLAAASGVLKLGYWRFIDTTNSPATAASATGLGRFGTVRMLDPPHREENFLLREMGFRLARKYARRLRRLTVLFAFALPALLALLSSLVSGMGATLLAAAAASLATAGVLIERWLFFAEAKHTVMLYYGSQAA
jgi:DMSO reductase anchor subunit